MAKTFKTYEEALEAQGVAKDAVKEAKAALTEYYTKNKLKRNEDYTDDAKHGGKIQKLQNAIDRESSTLENIGEQMKALKPKKEKSAGRETKYEYPADCVTSEQKKKYRIKMRKEAENADKPKKEKTEKPAPKKAAKAEKSSEPAPETKSAKKPVKKAAQAKEEEAAPKSPVKKVKKKVRKSSDD